MDDFKSVCLWVIFEFLFFRIMSGFHLVSRFCELYPQNLLDIHDNGIDCDKYAQAINTKGYLRVEHFPTASAVSSSVDWIQ